MATVFASRLRYFLLLSLCGGSAFGSELKPAGLTAEKSAEGVLIQENGQNVLFYQRKPKSEDGRYTRANYVHPLYGLAGEVLTEDFPADHRHHRGIFWAWHQLWLGEKKLGDAWSTKDFLARVNSVQVDNPKQKKVTLRAKVDWTSQLLTDDQGSPIPVVREETAITVFPRERNIRLIDFEIELKAIKPGVKIGGSEDQKGYSGFSARVKLTPETRFLGTKGPVEPETTAVKSGPWLDLSNSKNGVAILDHSANPGYPQPWILRRQRSMQNAAYPGREPVELSQEKPLVLKYRVVVHDGNLEPAAIDQLQQDWAKTTSSP